MSKIGLNPLTKEIGPLKGGYQADSLKMKGKIEEALVKEGHMDKVKAAKLAQKFRSGHASALGKKEAVRVMQSFKKAGLFKYEEKDIAGQVSQFQREEKRSAEEKNKDSNETKKTRVRQRNAMERALQQNREPQGLTNQAAAGATPSFGQPIFAAPLPDISKQAGQQSATNIQATTPAFGNNSQPEYQPSAPTARSADEPGQKSEPQDLQID